MDILESQKRCIQNSYHWRKFIESDVTSGGKDLYIINHKILRCPVDSENIRHEINTLFEIPPKTRTWYRSIKKGLVARHQERDDDEEAPRKNDHPGSKWSPSSSDILRSI